MDQGTLCGLVMNMDHSTKGGRSLGGGYIMSRLFFVNVFFKLLFRCSFFSVPTVEQ